MEERIIKDINDLLAQLFQKMHEAGYEWDAEKKELKKIVTPIFNIGDTIAKKHNSDINDFGSFTITDITGGKYWYNDRIICDITEQDEWELYEPVRQNPAAWSEEDEHWCQKAVDFIKHPDLIRATPTLAKDTIDWLKSLKDRHTWKPSEGQIASITCAVRKMKESACYDSELVSLFNDLKKLKE